MKFTIATLLAAVVSANYTYPSYSSHYPSQYGSHNPTSKSSQTHHYHVSKPHNPYDLKPAVSHYDGYKHHDDDHDDDDHDTKHSSTQKSSAYSHYTTSTPSTYRSYTKPAPTPAPKPVVKRSDPLDAIKYKLHSLEHRVKDLESSSILLDYFDVNGNAAITIAANGSVDVSDEFCVQKGQSVDIDVQVSLGTTDDVTLAIQMNGATVAAAQM